MKTKDFFKQLDDQRVVAAIQAAEKESSGEIRVFVHRSRVSDPVEFAKKQFVRLKMNRTQERNGVLIFVAPRSQNFAVIGDEAIHQKCGEVFWNEIAAAMTGHFRRGDFTSGVVYGIERAGEILARHFPRKRDDQNELADKVEYCD
ncbi:MAG: TPM domain-containing protein [bacterium]